MGPEAPRRLHHPGLTILGHVAGDRAQALGGGEALGHAVEREDARGPEEPRAQDRHQAHRTAADHGDVLAGPDVGAARPQVAGGQDVGEQHGLLGADAVGDGAERRVGVRDGERLGLAARQSLVAAEHRRGAPLAGRHPAPSAGAALRAAHHARHQHPVAALEAAHLAAYLHHLADRLVAHREAALGAQVSVVDVQVGAADGRALHPHHHAGGVRGGGVRDLLAADLLRPTVDERSHGASIPRRVSTAGA